MSTNTTMILNNISANGHSGFLADEPARYKATQWFANLRRRQLLRGFWQRLVGNRRQLLDLNETGRVRPVTSRHHFGLQTIPLAQIKGSEGRSRDFDADFFPAKGHNEGRWINIARLRLTGRSLPPVELVQLEDTYYVRDGHHRVSVARALGQQAIEAQVVHWQ